MEDQTSGNGEPVILKKSHRWRTFFVLFFLLLVSGLTILFFLFKDYGEKMARKYLQEKVLLASDSVYRADFSKLHINFLTGKVSIDSFELIPDSSRYAFLKQRGKTARALYNITFSSLTIDRVHFWQIYSGKRINFRTLTVQEPVINIVAYPDTMKVPAQRWRVFYEDIYPTVSDLFRDFHIDSVKVENGSFTGSFKQKTGRQSEGEYHFSAILKDVAVNPFSYYNKDRVFYSREVDLVIHNFDYLFPDSLYTLNAGEIGFSLTKSVIYGKEISLVPNFRKKQLKSVAGRDFYRFDLPSFSVGGLDLYKVLTGKTVDLDSVTLSNLKVKVYRYQSEKKVSSQFLETGNLDLSGLYSIVSREVKYIRIGLVRVNRGSFSYYASPFDPNPELKVGRVDLAFTHFLLDSLSHKDPSRLFYSKSIELAVKDFSLALRDGVHYIHASSAHFSTRNSLIDVNQCFIYPDRKKNDRDSASRLNLLDIKVPQLTFSGIDLKKVFNRRIVDFDRLVIREPDIHYTQVHPAKKSDSRFRNAEDFFETENEEVVYNLLKSYLWVVKGSSIGIEHGFASFSTSSSQTDHPAISGSFDLEMYQFLIDSVHGMNRQGYFYSEDFDLTLQSLSLVSPDSTHQFRAGTIFVKTRDSLIEARNLLVIRDNRDDISVAGKLALKASFFLKNLYLTGLNHKKLFLDKQLKADRIILGDPVVSLNSYPPSVITALPPEPDTTFSTDFIRSFDIGRCEVRNGMFSYKSQEDKVASYFSMKEIDFSVVNALLFLPEKEKKNGLIRFDSLQLSVLPLRAVLADSTYILEAGSLHVGSYPMNINLKGVRVTPISKVAGGKNKNLRFTMNIPDISINGFYFDKAIFNNQWDLDSIIMTRPWFQIAITKEEMEPGPAVVINPDRLFTIPVFMKSVNVNAFKITDGEFQMTTGTVHKPADYKISHFKLNLTRFHLDTASGNSPVKSPFNAEEITLQIPGFSWLSKDSLYTFSFGQFRFSTRTAAARIDTFTMSPNYSREDFTRKLGNQATIMNLQLPSVDLAGIDIRRLIADHHLRIARVGIPGLRFEAYLDQRIPPSIKERIPLPHDLLREFSYPLTLDTVSVTDARIQYEEQEGDEPGMIFFDQVKMDITGLSFPMLQNQENVPGFSDTSVTVNLYGSARLMGKGATEAWVRFYPAHPRDSFRLKARVNAMELTEINPMLSKLIPVSIRKGTLDKLTIDHFYANNQKAEGEMEMIYSNLQIKFHPLRSDPLHRIEKWLLTEGVNLVIPLSNPKEDGRIRRGIILHQHDSTRGFFNFIWKSTLSGIKSSVRVETKAQKTLRKQGIIYQH